MLHRSNSASPSVLDNAPTCLWPFSRRFTVDATPMLSTRRRHRSLTMPRLACGPFRNGSPHSALGRACRCPRATFQCIQNGTRDDRPAPLFPAHVWPLLDVQLLNKENGVVHQGGLKVQMEDALLRPFCFRLLVFSSLQAVAVGPIGSSSRD